MAEFKIGDLVQLLDVHGNVHERTLGTVTGFHQNNGRMYIHWFSGVKMHPHETFAWARIARAK